MALRVYNTLTQRKEAFETLEPGRVRMYVCGVTVYSPAHIGHAFMVVSFDVIRRYLQWVGYDVIHAQNFTDVDDKIIARAHEAGVDPAALAEGYVAEWRRDIADLGVLPPTIEPRATQEIGGMIEMIEGLIRRDYAYAVAGDVYFRVRRFPGYGKLSGRTLDSLQAGARVEVSEQKEDPLDFALWKAAKPGEPSWPSPFGPGRPGWHIECSVMSLQHLGGQLDIHGGGTDLIFPHHENEIAQSEAYTGHEPFARYWLHNEMLQLAGDKMSKSLGNLITVRELVERGPDAAQTFRFMALTGHYRTPLTWSEDSFESARRGLDRLRSPLRGWNPTGGAPLPDANGGMLAPQLAVAETEFRAALDDDFNTAGALAALFDLGRAINRARDEGTPPADVAGAGAKLVELLGVLGLNPPVSEAKPDTLAAAPFVDLLLETRGELRRAKQFALGDRIRDRLKELGIEVEDGPAGSTWRVVSV